MQVGDVVRLKSGGPRMTVVSIDMVFATCMWFTSYTMDDPDMPRQMVVRLSCLEREKDLVDGAEEPGTF